jgi:uncharacterized pyridoxal phosphate-containing UPF0001 family protein
VTRLPAAETREAAARLAPLVSERLEVVRGRIAAAGGDPGSVKVVAVTKTFGPEAVLAAQAAGLDEVGENYAAELLEKAAQVQEAGGRPRWHYLGAIQRNKVGRLAGVVSVWQGLSRAVEAEAIAARAGGERAAVFVEVNLATDPHRPGAPLDEVPGLVRRSLEAGLDVRGLMAVAPRPGSGPSAEEAFGVVARLRSSLRLEELSIGMTGDLEAAVRAGSTMLRVGRALFGPRDPHTAP